MSCTWLWKEPEFVCSFLFLKPNLIWKDYAGAESVWIPGNQRGACLTGHILGIFISNKTWVVQKRKETCRNLRYALLRVRDLCVTWSICKNVQNLSVVLGNFECKVYIKAVPRNWTGCRSSDWVHCISMKC